MNDPNVARLDPPLRSSGRSSVANKIVGPMRWFAHPLGALLTIGLAVLLIGAVEILYVVYDPAYFDGDFLYIARTVFLFGTPIALLFGSPLSVLLDRVLLTRSSVRAVHISAYAVVATAVPFGLVAAMLVDLSGVDARDWIFASLIAAPVGAGAAFSRHLMRRFEHAA